jgi:hypothetical protein
MSVMDDETKPLKARLDASRLLAERAFGKATNAEPEVVVVQAPADEVYRLPTRERAIELAQIARELDDAGLLGGVATGGGGSSLAAQTSS